MPHWSMTAAADTGTQQPLLGKICRTSRLCRTGCRRTPLGAIAGQSHTKPNSRPTARVANGSSEVEQAPALRTPHVCSPVPARLACSLGTVRPEGRSSQDRHTVPPYSVYPTRMARCNWTTATLPNDPDPEAVSLQHSQKRHPDRQTLQVMRTMGRLSYRAQQQCMNRREKRRPQALGHTSSLSRRRHCAGGIRQQSVPCTRLQNHT